jgi:hypothetical protein
VFGTVSWCRVAVGSAQLGTKFGTNSRAVGCPTLVECGRVRRGGPNHDDRGHQGSQLTADDQSRLVACARLGNSAGRRSCCGAHGPWRPHDPPAPLDPVRSAVSFRSATTLG